jgi:hypothetical protein
VIIHRSFGGLLTHVDRGCTAASMLIDVESFNQFFAENVTEVRAETNALSPALTRVRSGVSFDWEP